MSIVYTRRAILPVCRCLASVYMTCYFGGAVRDRIKRSRVFACCITERWLSG